MLEGADVDRPVRLAVRRVRLKGRLVVRFADRERLGGFGRGPLVDAEKDERRLDGRRQHKDGLGRGHCQGCPLVPGTESHLVQEVVSLLCGRELADLGLAELHLLGFPEDGHLGDIFLLLAVDADEDLLRVRSDEVFDVLPAQEVQFPDAVLVVLAERLQRVERDKLGFRRLERGREERRD